MNPIPTHLAALRRNMGAAPFFSIITPVYNRAHLLPRAVQSAMRQTFADWGLFIVDDGSTDETSAVAASLCAKDARVSMLTHSHCGLARTRNLGIRNAQGAYITFLDSDDEYAPEHLQTRFAYLNARPETDLLQGGVLIDGNEFVADKFNPSKTISLRECVIGGTFVVRRALVDSLGGFPHVDYGDDSAFYSNALEKAPSSRR